MLDKELLIKKNVCQPAILRIADDIKTQALYKKSVTEMSDIEKIIAMQKEGNYEYAYWGMAYCMDIADDLLNFLHEKTDNKYRVELKDLKAIRKAHKELSSEAEVSKDKMILRAICYVYCFKQTNKKDFIFKALMCLIDTDVNKSVIDIVSKTGK